jgi:hypothetical protein
MPLISSTRGNFGAQGKGLRASGPIGTLANPATSGIALKNAGYASGVYYIRTTGMTTAVQAYVDNDFSGGGWILCTYGFVADTGAGSSNRVMPNMNHDGSSFPYNSSSRASSRGILAAPGGQKSTLLIAKASTECLMAAGGNPSSGGINNYTYAWKFTIPSPSSLTFANHSNYYNGSMGISTVTVYGLKGETGTYTGKQLLTESLGSSWGDSYPTGYGPVTIANGTVKGDPNAGGGGWNSGPHFPSIHSGSRASSRQAPISSSPDLGFNGFFEGESYYTYRGWYTANGTDYTGQMSIWFR